MDAKNLVTQADSEGFAFDSLESVRNKLLDLTSRNTLLNYRHPTASCVRVIESCPDHTAQTLIDDKTLTFEPIPEPTEEKLIEAGYCELDAETGQQIVSGFPTAEQWAKHLGHNTAYELSDTTNSNNTLQTLRYSSKLEAVLGKLRSKAGTAIEENGANILYLGIGFLEWYESRDSDKKRLAPLFTIPVKLERSNHTGRKNTYRYTLSIKDDGILTNLSLKEKLKHDFGLILPEIDEDTIPSVYFDTIQNALLNQQPSWRIKKYISLTLLNFTKQAMYLDLDPSNWPASANIEDHPIIAEFFSSTGKEGDSGSASYETEHPIDTVDDIHKHFPLVFDADSSQHSAIIDATRGENLVIEEPPGSGKSQTITNIIAASIGNGKKVLFVAEKMAALNVVKDRLDRIGLGEFCLELHSHKTSKQKVLADLKSRLNKSDHYRKPKEIDAEIAHFETLKTKLADYASQISDNWGETGLTVHTILNKATRYREKLSISPDQMAIAGLDGKNFTPVRQKELMDQAEMLTRIYDSVSEQAEEGDIANHYWYGVNNTELQGYQVDELSSVLRQWTSSLETLQHTLTQIKNKGELSISEQATLVEIQQLSGQINKLPSLMGEEPLVVTVSLAGKSLVLQQVLEQYQAIHSAYEGIFKYLSAAVFSRPDALLHLDNTLKLFKSLGVSTTTPLEAISYSLKTMKDAQDKTRTINEKFNDVIPSVDLPLKGCFIDSIQGLYEFSTLIELINQLPVDLWRHRDDVYDDPDLDPLLEKMTHKLGELTPLHNELHQFFNLHDLPESATLRVFQSILENRGVFKWFSGQWRNTRKSLLGLSSLPKANFRQLLSFLPTLIQYAEGIEHMDQLNQSHQSLNNDYEGIKTPIERLAKLRTWYKAVRAEYGVGFGNRTKIGDALIGLDRNQAMAIKDFAAKELPELIQSVQHAVTRLSQLYSRHCPLRDKHSSINESVSKLLDTVEGQISEVEALINQNNVADASVTVGDLDSVKHSLAEQCQRLTEWKTNAVVQKLEKTGLTLSVAYQAFSEADLQLAGNTLAIIRVLESAPEIKESLNKSPDNERYTVLQDSGQQLERHLTECDNHRQAFMDAGKVNPAQWLASTNASLTATIARNQKAMDNPQWLGTWLGYIKLRDKLSAGGLEKITHELERHNISSRMLRDVVVLVAHHQLAKEVLQEHPALGTFFGREQSGIREQFQKYDRKLMKLQQQLIAFNASRTSPPAGISSGKIKNLTELSLIKYNLNLIQPRISIRSLLKRAPKSIQALKPCFLMSPMSVAQYLEPGNYDFDMIVMDEASQIRPEDALGAIARGKSLVVVGDPKQLPPTSFFQKTMENENDDEIVALEDSESILDSVIPLFKNRRLRWHYRSRHESLIAFSNQNFYDSNLILFPSPFNNSEAFGIRYKFVQGRFVNRKNVEEARILVNSVATQLQQNPSESVGIVAMNAEQSDEIERQLEQRIKDDPLLQRAYEKNLEGQEKLFVKNLENVQGDERDVIIISMTYGPETIGANTMHQRFGPINSNAGWRRLNVLFTRSKKRMHIFSSMRSGYIQTKANSLRGVKALKAFLEYCETGRLQHYQHTGKAPDSDFEIAVMSMLNAHGYECEPQLGVAGYFLDLAVKDPGMPGRFLMGIECDGASYHSAKSTRDRDRLRQEILESLGWKIRRIWSTDWFDNPQAQIQPILRELDSLKTPPSEATQIEWAASAQEDSDEPDRPDQDSAFEQQLMSENVQGRRQELNTILIRYEQEVIRVQNPDIPENGRLLRPAMLEALLENRPCSRADFQEKIPSYLREGTDASEAKYLDEVLHLISLHG